MRVVETSIPWNTLHGAIQAYGVFYLVYHKYRLEVDVFYLIIMLSRNKVSHRDTKLQSSHKRARWVDDSPARSHEASILGGIFTLLGGSSWGPAPNPRSSLRSDVYLKLKGVLNHIILYLIQLCWNQ